MAVWIQVLAAIVVSIMASGGLWNYLQFRKKKHDSKTRIILGLGHDRIIALGMRYIDRGWISKDEYENLVKFIFKPYKKLEPDDGSVSKVMQEVERLPIRRA